MGRGRVPGSRDRQEPLPRVERTREPLGICGSEPLKGRQSRPAVDDYRTA